VRTGRPEGSGRDREGRRLSRDGMGRLFVQSMFRGDYLVVLPWLMVTVTFVALFNLVADVTYAVLDPRSGTAEPRTAYPGRHVQEHQDPSSGGPDRHG